MTTERLYPVKTLRVSNAFTVELSLDDAETEIVEKWLPHEPDEACLMRIAKEYKAWRSLTLREWACLKMERSRAKRQLKA